MRFRPGGLKIAALKAKRYTKKVLTILLASGLFAAAVYCALTGYRDQRLLGLSRGASEVPIRLDAAGVFSVTVDPPGRSLFRPGGVLEIFLTRGGVPVKVEAITLGSGTLRVTDHTGRLCLEYPLDELGVASSSVRESYWNLPLREFKTSGGGPYRVDFEIVEPFRGLEGTLQTLSAHHFVSGGEVACHYLAYGAAALSGGLCLLLIWKVSRPMPQAEATKGGPPPELQPSDRSVGSD